MALHSDISQKAYSKYETGEIVGYINSIEYYNKTDKDLLQSLILLMKQMQKSIESNIELLKQIHTKINTEN